MKILHVINSLNYGGAEKLIVETLPLYVKDGNVVDLLLLKGNRTKYYDELISKNINKVFVIGNGSVYNPLLILKLIPYIRQYDVIHVHLFPALYYTFFAKLFSLSNTKLVFTEHSTSNRRFRNKCFGLIDNIVYKKYDAIICITELVKKKLLGHTKVKETRIRLIENGVNLKIIKESSALKRNIVDERLKAEDFIIIQVSSFQEPKDQNTVIRSLVLLPETYKLVLVGEGVRRKESEELVNSLDLKNRVIFLGFRSDVINLLKMSDIIILSSRYEGLSLSSIEGMASGRPFFGSDVPGIKDIVGGAGVLFAFGDDVALAENILNIATDSSWYSNVVNNCLVRAERFDITIMVDKTLGLYKEIING